MNGIGDNLKRVRLLKNISLQSAADLLNMSATAVQKYEKGEIIPDSKKLIEFANIYNIKSIDLLKSYDRPQMKFTSFRKKKRLKGKNLELLKETILDEVSKNLEVIQTNKLNFNSIKFKKYSIYSIDDIEKSAINFRNYIKISNIQPISDLLNILENLGIVIIQIKNSNNKFSDFDGLSEIVNGIPIIVLLDDISDGARQRFTIAHELGHLVLNVKNDNLDEEFVCNMFASALLMPMDAVINEFGTKRNNISFFELVAFKKEYKVSYTAIIYRLRNLKIISEYTYKKLSIFINSNIGKNDPDKIAPETSYQFKKTVHKLEKDEIISLNKACELLGISINEYYREDNYYGY